MVAKHTGERRPREQFSQPARVWAITNLHCIAHETSRPPKSITTMAQPVRDLIEIVYDQLPPQLKKELAVNVETDGYYIRPYAIFTDAKNREWKVALIDEEFEGMKIRCKVPEEFLAQLCAVV